LTNFATSLYHKNGDYMILGIIFWLVMAKPVFAYLDPGSGSYLLQVIVGVFLAGGYAIKLYWTKITEKFKGKNKDN